MLQAKVELPEQVKEPSSPRSPGIISGLIQRGKSNLSLRRGSKPNTNGSGFEAAVSLQQARAEWTKRSISVPSGAEEHTPLERVTSAPVGASLPKRYRIHSVYSDSYYVETDAYEKQLFLRASH